MRIKKLERQQFAMHANTYWWDANNEYDGKKRLTHCFNILFWIDLLFKCYKWYVSLHRLCGAVHINHLTHNRRINNKTTRINEWISAMPNRMSMSISVCQIECFILWSKKDKSSASRPHICEHKRTQMMHCSGQILYNPNNVIDITKLLTVTTKMLNSHRNCGTSFVLTIPSNFAYRW